MVTPRPEIGGGVKKILYALSTLSRIGLENSAKALTAKNTCKACGLGMGGQKGGMTNEASEFPSVCNKSIQAQSTDIQPGIPPELFSHSICDWQALSGHEIEHLGRLAFPVYKAKNADQFSPIGWDEALDIAADRFRTAGPDRSFFYSSGRASNEAGFVLQLLARTFGSNHINTCAFYCHQATSVGLASTLGTGTSTVELDDLNLCDFILVVGANPASNHPRFIHKLKGVRDRGGEVMIINPVREAGLVRFALPKSPKSLLKGGDEIASEYLIPKIGADLVLLKAFAKAILEAGLEAREFITNYCEDFAAFREDCQKLDWREVGERTGLGREEITQAAHKFARAKKAVIAWGMGITHHLHGSANVEYLANLALLCGHVGKQGAGLLPLRGHSNVQGIGTIGVKPVLAEEVMQKLEAHFGLNFTRGEGFDTMKAMKAAFQGDMKAALLMGGNLYESNPDSAFAQKALERIDFKLSLTTTLNRGHFAGLEGAEAMILPVTARDEEWQPTTQESMFNYVRLSDGGIHRLKNVRPESVILVDLATRLLPDCGFDFAAFKNHSKIRDAIAATVPGMGELKDIDIAKHEFHVRGRLLHKPDFKTKTGKASFVVRAHDDGRASADYPYLLASVRSEGQFNSIIYEEKDTYRGVSDRQTILLSFEDMASNGYEDGQWVRVVSPYGAMERVKLKGFDMAKGSVLAYFPEANCLIGTEVDPRSFTPAFKSTPVRLELLTPIENQ